MRKTRHSLLISRYIVGAIIPYFLLVWLLLSVILFVQQGTRFSDLIFNASLPPLLIWQFAIALIPNVIAFTSPIALLVGVVIGLSRMQGDSEMTAIRAAGTGKGQVVLPVLLLGILLSGFALFVNLKGVPFAAQIARQVALQAALYKLQSPVDPGVFNSEINDLTIFVKDGDVASGKWRNIFVLQKNDDGSIARLITASEGFIATKGEDSEIVLDNSEMITFESAKEREFALENVKRVRLSVQTKRGEIVERLAKTKATPEELGLAELAGYAADQEGIERTEAWLLWQRRLLLSFTPLIFSLLGAALISKFNRGGRGLGVVLALVALVGYYSVTLVSEQLARTGAIRVSLAGFAPLLASTAVILWLFWSRRVTVRDFGIVNKVSELLAGIGGRFNSSVGAARFILDRDIVSSLVRNYALTLGFLTVMFVLFTAFELWKFAGTIDNGVSLLTRYLFYLIPFIYVQISPSALMVAALATYVIKTRQNEVVTWAAAGRSVYRLLLPCFVVAAGIGLLNFGVQELILSDSNREQDRLRAQIRSRNEVLKKTDEYWIAGQREIISFQQTGASDNEKAVRNLRVYKFKPESSRLESITTAESGFFRNGSFEDLRKPLLLSWDSGGSGVSSGSTRSISVKGNPFTKSIVEPSHLNISETREKIADSESPIEKTKYTVTLYKKYAAPFLPFIVCLLTAPFALSIHRSGNVITIAYAAGIWLSFIGVTTVFEQFGQSGMLLPVIAVSGPLVIFGLIGLMLLSRVRT